MRILKKHSTKPERIVYEILKELRLPFKHRWLIRGKEVDFVLGKIVLEIDGHPQDETKNLQLIEMGYVPIHFSNQEIINNREIIKKELLKYVFTN